MTVNDAVAPSVRVAASATDTVGRPSSSRISTVASPSPSSALGMVDNVSTSRNVSACSMSSSLISGTVTVSEVTPAQNPSSSEVAAV